MVLIILDSFKGDFVRRRDFQGPKLKIFEGNFVRRRDYLALEAFCGRPPKACYYFKINLVLVRRFQVTFRVSGVIGRGTRA